MSVLLFNDSVDDVKVLTTTSTDVTVTDSDPSKTLESWSEILVTGVRPMKVTAMLRSNIGVGLHDIKLGPLQHA